MKKKRLVVIFLLFMFLASMEVGIFIESALHGFSPGSGTFMEYTKIGNIGTTFLLLFFPVTAIIIFYHSSYVVHKKSNNMKEFCFDCLFALIGTGIGIFLSLYNPITYLGAMITSFLIDYFDWMKLIL